MADLQDRINKTWESQRVAEAEIKTHRPTRDEADELICERCETAAPCERALSLMDICRQARQFRIDAMRNPLKLL